MLPSLILIIEQKILICSMSNQKGKGGDKQKKSEGYTEQGVSYYSLQRKYEQLRSQLVEKDIKLKRLEETNSDLVLRTNECVLNYNYLRKSTDSQIEKLQVNIDSLKQRVSELTTLKNELEIQNATYKAKLEHAVRQNQDLRKDKEKDLDDYKRHISGQINRYEGQSVEYNIAISERSLMIAEKENLLKILASERAEAKKNLADKDREKIQALDTLKQEMIEKIRVMKIDLLSIRRDQMTNNARLTMLQNNQLVQELEYQSSNTQKVVLKNIELEKKVKQLELEIIIQKDVEKQVTKRVLIARKMLTTYYHKNQDLQKKICAKREASNGQKQGTKGLISDQEAHNKMNLLSQSLENAYSHIELMEKQKCLLQAQLQQFSTKYDGLSRNGQSIAVLLQKYYTQIIEGKISAEKLKMQPFDFSKIKNIDANMWKPYECQITVKMLLNSLRPWLEMKNFDFNYWRSKIQKRHQQENDQNKQNRSRPQSKQQQADAIKFDANKPKSISLDKRKLFYGRKRRISAKQENRESNRENKSVSMSKYVQSNLRKWGNQTKHRDQKSIAERFMRPLKSSAK